MKASDIMTAPVITISPGTPVPEIAALLFEQRISGVPVVSNLLTKEIVMKLLTLKRSILTASILAEFLARFVIPAAIASAFLASAAPVFAQHTEHVVVAQAPAAAKVAETSAAQRDLWVGHIFWVRNVVTETLAGNKKAAAAAEKEVVANAKAIATSIEPFYGNAASEKLFGLLAGHYGAVKQYLDATAAGSQAKQDAAVKNLTGNATEIAKFLSGANPNLPFDTLNGLLLAHGGHHLQEIQQLKSKQYAQEAQTWEAMKKHMYVIADALAGAIAKQFPAKFS
jgi:CBS domain-containing protein